MRKVTFNYFACLVETGKRLLRALFVSHTLAFVFVALFLFKNFYIRILHQVASNIAPFNCLQIS